MVQAAIEKASVLIDALPYIQRFRGETVVVKFGGSIMDDEQGVRDILKDIAFMACVGLRPVIVHGGGKAISRGMEKEGLVPRFIHGLRVTDEASVRIVEHVINHEVNPHMVEILEEFQCKARGMHGDDLIRVRPTERRDADTGEVMDLGYVGEVTEVDVAPVQAFLQGAITPVITPLGRGPDNRVYNVNADEAAAGLARGLKARKLVFLSDVPGLLRDPADPGSLISHVERAEVDRLIETGVIAGGMLPKIGGAVSALDAGVRKTHIIDASLPHSLLLELFTESGVGTEIVR
jgi:acetylglutamate kinase